MSVSIGVLEEFAEKLPSDPSEQLQVLELGLRELRIQKALDAFGRGEGTLAFAARRARIPLRQMIPLAYAHGLEPAIEPSLAQSDSLSLAQASDL